MHLIHVTYFEGEKNTHKNKYFLSSSSMFGLLLNLFSASTVSFVSQRKRQPRSIQPFVSVSHFRFSPPLYIPKFLASAAHSTHPDTQASALFPHSCSPSGSGSFLTAVCVADVLSPHQCPERLRTTCVRTDFTLHCPREVTNTAHSSQCPLSCIM